VQVPFVFPHTISDSRRLSQAFLYLILALASPHGGKAAGALAAAKWWLIGIWAVARR